LRKLCCFSFAQRKPLSPDCESGQLPFSWEPFLCNGVFCQLAQKKPPTDGWPALSWPSEAFSEGGSAGSVNKAYHVSNASIFTHRNSKQRLKVVWQCPSSSLWHRVNCSLQATKSPMQCWELKVNIYYKDL
jgi:hypothetical protein